MSTHLRLDMYVNSSEYLICEAPATEDGFEDCLSASDVVTHEIATEIRRDGASKITADMLGEDMLDILWDITGREITERDDINFCMCLWDGDEHLESLFSISKIQ
jgi:hypothetical protein